MITTHLAAFSFFDGAGPILDGFDGFLTAPCLMFFDGLGTAAVVIVVDDGGAAIRPVDRFKKKQRELDLVVALLLAEDDDG